MKHIIRAPLVRSTVVLTLLLIIQGCDSGDPIDDGGQSSSPVAGTYLFESFSVEPTASRIPPLDMLDTLVLDDSRLQLFDGGDFVLAYRYIGGQTAAVIGRYTHTAREVRLQADPTSSDLHDLRSLLMENQLVLQRGGQAAEVLSASFRKTVDMAVLSDGYAEIPPLGATVRFQVREQVAAAAR